MQEFKFSVSNRSYDCWSIYDANTLKMYDHSPSFLNPYNDKLFNNDIFTFSTDELNNKIHLIHSVVRESQNIPCVLVLEENKTYGRFNLSKLLYRCIPNDSHLPAFLVPYELKSTFSKKYINKYVTINFSHWNNKHPHGTITQVIGDVNILSHIYEYQLHCKSLISSIKLFQKHAHDAIVKFENSHTIIQQIFLKYPNISNRPHLNVFTIDGVQTTDFDDAFSYQLLPNGSKIISIYISNVPIIMDHLNLWNSFSNRISTIYLPDNKRPMLPSNLSDDLCSLKSGEFRICFTQDIYLDIEGNIMDIQFCNSIIRVNKNYVYDTDELNSCDDYQQLLSTVCQLSSKYKYLNNIADSHDLVAYLMILMNYYVAIELLKYRCGIYRVNILSTFKELPCEQTDVLTDVLPNEIKNYIKIWNSSQSKYTLLGDEQQIMRHDALNVDAYVHITSPIRRMVDLLNMIQIQHNLELMSSATAMTFYGNWCLKMDYINKMMKNIQNVQKNCELITMCMNDERMYGRTYTGYCFNKIDGANGLYEYTVYLPDIKVTDKITTTTDMPNYTIGNYKLHLFNDEDNLKKKIKIQLIQNI